MYPPHLQACRVTSSTISGPTGASSALGPSMYLSYTQQVRGDYLTPRDREPCLVMSLDGTALSAGYYLCRLVGSYTDLPVYAAIPAAAGSLAIWDANGTNGILTSSTTAQTGKGEKWVGYSDEAVARWGAGNADVAASHTEKVSVIGFNNARNTSNGPAGSVEWEDGEGGTNGTVGSLALMPDPTTATPTKAYFEFTTGSFSSGTTSGALAIRVQKYSIVQATTADFIVPASLGSTVTVKVTSTAGMSGGMSLVITKYGTVPYLIYGTISSVTNGTDFVLTVNEIARGALSGTVAAGAYVVDTEVNRGGSATTGGLTFYGGLYKSGTINLSGVDGSGLTGVVVADGDKGDISVTSSGTVWTIDGGVVTFAKMQAVSTNVILGNDGSGSTVQEITCTSAGRALLDDANASAQRTTLGLAIGTDVQAWSTSLDDLAAVSPVADGTYTVGARLTGGGTDGSITVSKGLITAVTEAT